MLHTPKPPYLGAAYYPECWDRELIDEDIARMKEAGINCVRVAEFAWSTMEPREGEFDFAWLHEALDKLYAAGIAVVLGTPSATPPKWLTDRYEETLTMRQNGVRAQFGGRYHTCKTSPVMREKNRIIVTKMCEEFRGHPAVIGWQVDNELFPYDEGCFCPLCKKKFSAWLREKYGEIGILNKKWGTKRWSQEYASFDDVIPPRGDTWNHPSLQTDWLHFTSDNIISYANEQAEIIHRYFDVPVGTDMMAHCGLDHVKVCEKMDVAQFNHYEKEGDLGHAAFWFDFIRPIKKHPFWVTETQTGWFGNTVSVFGYRAKGNVYVNSWLPIALGGEMNEYWHWRSHYAGHELHFGSLLTTAGRFTHTLSETQHVSSDFETCADLLCRSAVHAEIAISMSATASFTLKYAPIIEGLDYPTVLCERYRTPLRDRNVDLIDTLHTLDGYKVLISPLLTCADENGFKERVLRWVAEGGKWIVGPMSDIYTDYGAKYEKSPFGFLEEVAGVRLKYQLPLPTDRFRAAWEDGSPLEVGMYFDGYECTGAKSLAKYTNEALEGLTVIAEMPYGKGSIVTVGALIDAASLRRLVGMEPPISLSPNVQAVYRSGERKAVILLEMENKEGKAILDRPYTDLLTGKIVQGEFVIEPYCVYVLA